MVPRETSVKPLPVRFTEAQAQAACDGWKFNCGPAAVAALYEMTPDELRPYLGDFESKGYTNPALMWEILDRLQFSRTWMHRPPADKRWPKYGLVRIQWHGQWMNIGVPKSARYRHTHWIGACTLDDGDTGIFDVNAMRVGGWTPLKAWESLIVPWILRECVPKSNGDWSITHVVEVARWRHDEAR